MADSGNLYDADVRLILTGFEAAAGIIQGVTSATSEFDGAISAASPAIDKATAAMGRLSAAEKAAAASAAAAGDAQAAASAKYAEGFQARLTALAQFKAAELRAAQVSVVAGGVDGTNAESIARTKSIAQLREFIATDEARETKALSVSRKIVASYDAEAAAARAAMASEVLSAAEVAAARQTAASNARYVPGASTAGLSAAEINAMSSAYGRTTTAAAAATRAEAEVAASATTAAAAHTRLSTSLASTQYALFNAASSLALFGGVLIALAAGPAVVAAAYQREFANVERTVTGAGQTIKYALMDLSTQIPVSFKDLTQIAALGGQLGIDKDGIVQFTSTVAKLTATTNLSADAAGTLLGRFKSMAGLKPDQFDAFGSALLYAGVKSVATETQISQIATRIVGIGQTAGFTTPQIIALSAALGSIGSSSRSAQAYSTAMLQFITGLQKNLASGGAGLTAFAKTAGVSAQDVRKAFGTPEFAAMFNKFVGGLDGVKKSGGNVQTILASLGLTGSQAITMFNNLAPTIKQVLALSDGTNAAFASNAKVINEQYGKIAQTATSKFKEAGNAAVNFVAILGDATTGPVGTLADMLKNILAGLTGIAQNKIAQWAIAGASVVGILAGTLALAGAGAAVTVGGMIALTRALIGMNAQGLLSRGIVGTLTGELIAMGGAGRVAGIGITVAGTALKALTFAGVGAGIGAGIVVGISAANSAIDDFLDNAKGWKRDVDSTLGRATDKDLFGIGVSALKSNNELDDFARGLDRFFGNANMGTQFGRQVKELDDGLTQLAQNKEFTALSANLVTASKKTGISIDELVKKDFPSLRAELDASGAKLKGGSGDLSKFTIATKESTAAVKKQADELAESAAAAGLNTDALTRLMIASGLTAKQITAFDTAFGKSVGKLGDFNTVIGQVQKAQTDQVNATAAANKTKATDAQLTGAQTVSLSAYVKQLRINTAEARSWGGDLATLNSQLTQTFGAGTSQQIVAGLLSAGDTAESHSILKALINGTATDREAYVKATTDAVDAASAAAGSRIIAAGGLVPDAGGAISAATSKKIGAMFTAGFDIDAIMERLKLKFGNLDIPTPDIKPKVDTTQAKTEMQQFYDNWNLKQIPTKPTADTKPAKAQMEGFFGEWNLKQIPTKATVGTGDANSKLQNLYNSWAGKVIPITLSVSTRTINVVDGTRSAAVAYTGGYFDGNTFSHYDTGGYTGDGGKYVPAGLVHKSEFVWSSEATRTVGVPEMAYAHKLAKQGIDPFAAAAAAGANGMGGTVVAELSPYDRALLSDIRDRTGISLGVPVLQQAVGIGNVNSSRRGAA